MLHSFFPCACEIRLKYVYIFVRTHHRLVPRISSSDSRLWEYSSLDNSCPYEIICSIFEEMETAIIFVARLSEGTVRNRSIRHYAFLYATPKKYKPKSYNEKARIVRTLFSPGVEETPVCEKKNFPYPGILKGPYFLSSVNERRR